MISSLRKDLLALFDQAMTQDFAKSYSNVLKVHAQESHEAFVCLENAYKLYTPQSMQMRLEPY